MTKTDEKILILKRITRRLTRRLANAERMYEAANKQNEIERARTAKLTAAYRSLKSGGAQATPASIPAGLEECYTKALGYATTFRYKDKEKLHFKKTTASNDFSYVTWQVEKIADDLVDLAYIGEFTI